MRIAIVNQMPAAVAALRAIIRAQGKHQAVWTAADGEDAVAQCERDRPDLILMDLVMPRMDGIEATRRIMTHTPCAILIVTVSTADQTAKIFEAMGAGALNVSQTPFVAGEISAEGRKSLLAKIETIRRIQAVQGSEAKSPALPAHPSQPALVCIGSSAGGPAALARVLSGLPANFPASVVIVQHVDAQFAQGLAEWLASQTRLPVRLANEGEHLESGVVLLAKGDHHLVLAGPRRLGYRRATADCAYRPSVDVFFNTVGEHRQGLMPPVSGLKSPAAIPPAAGLQTPDSKLQTSAPTIGVLLTGMGRDGAKGLLALRTAGFHTIAQDQASCAVFGMPKAAAEINAAMEILALDKIGPRLVNMLLSKA